MGEKGHRMHYTNVCSIKEAFNENATGIYEKVLHLLTGKGPEKGPDLPTTKIPMAIFHMT
jgi:hypothetical protein